MELWLLEVPQFEGLAIPENEKEAASVVRSTLVGMGSFVENFREAVSLFEFARANDRSKWCFIAAIDGAQSIFNFIEANEGISHTLNACPSVKAAVNVAARRAFNTNFRAGFPHAANIRHGVAHSGNLYSRSENVKINRLVNKYNQYGVYSGGWHSIYGQSNKLQIWSNNQRQSIFLLY